MHSLAPRREIPRGFAEPPSNFERASCCLYSPCRSHLYRRDSFGPLEGFWMDASFARHAPSAVRRSVRPRPLRLMIVISAVGIVSILPALGRADHFDEPPIVLVHRAWAPPPLPD